MPDILKEKTLIKEMFRDVLLEIIREERIKFYDTIIPTVSDEEMKDIEKRYGSSSKYKKEDFVDMTDWVMNES
ncbi:MAG: hypothetical protein M1419_01870 [Bacteroidetes bacterium]|nr:hypothetical protein [Bacteroidota bacterium]